MNDLRPARAEGAFMARRELFVMAGLAFATLLVCSYFAPRGFRAGFVDMAHDGYQIRQVLDLDAGGVIFKDTFDQYGPVSGYLNLAAYRLLGHTLLAVKYGVALWYAAIAILIYRIARHLLPVGLSAAAVVVWLALAPFYQHGIMISPHAYILFFQAVGTLAIIRFAETDRFRDIALAGVCCGLCWALKTTMGVLFAVATIAYLIGRPLPPGLRVRRTAMAIGTLLGTTLLVVAVTLGWLWSHGALSDWYRQTVAFPRAFYIDERAASGAPSRFSFPVLFAASFLLLNLGVTGVDVEFCWHLMRVVVVVWAAILWRRREAPEALLIIGCLTPVLWLGAYPSANFMHQWWTASLTIPAFVYCARLAVRHAVARWPRLTVRNEAWTTVAVLVIVFLPSASQRMLAARTRAHELTETLDVPRVLRGVRTDKPTAEAFHAIYAGMLNFKRHHPAVRVVSNDHCDGFSNCVAESLLWLSFLDDNPHDHPIYWPLPVVSTTLYPDYNARLLAEAQRRPTLIVDSWHGITMPDNGIDGYELLVGVRVPGGYWYVFAPVHPEAAAHGEMANRLDQSGMPLGMVGQAGTKRIFDEALDPATGASRKLPLYTWPGTVEIPPIHEPEPLDITTSNLRDPQVEVDGGRWLLRGFMKSNYEPMLGFDDRWVNRGEYLVATGTIRQGRFRFLLLHGNDIAGYLELPNRGPFAVVFIPPRSGRYQLQLSHSVPPDWLTVAEQQGWSGLYRFIRGTMPMDIDVDRVGWVNPHDSSPVMMVYPRHHPVQLDSDEQLREAQAAAERAEVEARLAEERREQERRAQQRLAEERHAREIAAAELAESQKANAIPEPRIRFEHVVDAQTGRQQEVPLYSWPEVVDVPDPLPEPGLLDATAGRLGPTLKVEHGRWTVRGSAVSRYAYLLRFDDVPVDKGDYFVATGTIDDGGLTFGIQQNEKWVGMANVTQPGPFAVVLMPPRSERYSLVLANNVQESTSTELIRRHGLFGLWSALSGAKRPNVFQIDRAGWIHNPAAPIDTTPPVRAAEVSSQHR